MPRKSRIDAPGALHHIIIRGIERRKILLDDFDRENFLKRLGTVLSVSQSVVKGQKIVHDEKLESLE